MNKHRIRKVDLPDVPVPFLFIEIQEDTWLDMSINLEPGHNLHDDLHAFLDAQSKKRTIPITYATRAFHLFPDLQNYEEGVIE